MTIPSCFEVGTGRPVELPLGHLAITGQTQEAGKTTAIEALATRSGRKAIAFVTKRGEGSFIVQHPIPPYFAEPVNDAENPLWKWVKGILESNQQRKMTFEESWLIKACQSPRQAKNLADVALNIKALLSGESHVELKHKKGAAKGKMEQVRVWTRKPVSGMNESIYTSLDAYFQIVLPQLAKLPASTKLKLHPGLNVMDLSDYATDTQALVIRSVLEWVYRHETRTIVIIPEAWEFVPRGKNSPVRMAAEIFIRKAAAMQNFLWIDSQDMEGVDYVLLRGIKVWLLGVQRQRDEVARTLDSIPDLPEKPKKTEILTLQKGQFIACFGTEIRKVYVQPAWMESEVHAQAIARGEESVASAGKILDEFVETREESNDETENESGNGLPETGQAESEVQMREAGAVPGSHAGDNQGTASAISGVSGEYTEGVAEGSEIGDEAMWREKFEELKAQYDPLVEAHDALAERVRILVARVVALEGRDITEIAPGLAPPARVDSARSAASRGANGGSAGVGGNAESARVSGASPLPIPETTGDWEHIWKFVKFRALSEQPRILKILAERPELHIVIEKPVLEVNGANLAGQCGRLLADGFFAQPKAGTQAQKEVLRRFSNKTPTTNLYNALDKMVSQGFLTKETDGYLAVPGMKVTTKEAGK